MIHYKLSRTRYRPVDTGIPAPKDELAQAKDSANAAYAEYVKLRREKKNALPAMEGRILQ